MSDYILNRDAGGMVGYLYVNDGKHPVVGRTKFENARWMIGNDKRKAPRMSGEYPGFPLTADGVYFFDGTVSEGESEGETTSSVTADAAPPSPEGEGFESTAPVCGPDWCEIPELAEDGADGAMIQTGVNADVVKASDIVGDRPRKRGKRGKAVDGK